MASRTDILDASKQGREGAYDRLQGFDHDLPALAVHLFDLLQAVDEPGVQHRVPRHGIDGYAEDTGQAPSRRSTSVTVRPAARMI